MDKRIAVVMCTWRRIQRLSETIKMLESQTYKSFDFYIWNNNSSERANVDKLAKSNIISISVHHSKDNVGGIGRFYYAQKIANEYDYIVFIDDDQNFTNTFISHMTELAKPTSIVSWFGWKILGEYFNRTRIQNMGEVDYCGTGGMIIDSKIFTTIKYDIPKQFMFVEDLWLSYYAKYEHGYKLYGCDAPIQIIVDGKDQYVGLKHTKKDFLNYLKIKYGI